MKLSDEIPPERFLDGALDDALQWIKAFCRLDDTVSEYDRQRALDFVDDCTLLLDKYRNGASADNTMQRGAK